MNKKSLIAALFALVAVVASAEIQPQRINFQGKLINPATNNPQTGPVTLTFNLYNVPTGGSSLYTETQLVPLVNGVFSVEIGTINAISRELFLGASVYLGVTVSGDAGGEMTPRQDLVMSAYAFSANQLSDNTEVRMVAGLTYSTFTSAGNLIVPAGVSASSGSFTNGVTASSGTFTATGVGEYALSLSTSITFAQSAGNGLGIRWGDGTISTTAASGGGGLASVTPTAALTGNGTSGSPLGVNSSSVPVFGTGENLTLPYGVAAGSAAITNGLTASSATLTYGVTAATMTLTASVGSTITATGAGLTMLETGDSFGSVALSLENRNGVNGALFRQLGTYDLVDFVFQGLSNQRNIRYENRSGSQYMADPEFQIGSAGAPTLVVSDIGAYLRTGSLGLATATPLSLLDVNGNSTIRGAETVTGTTTVLGGSAAVYSLTTSSGIEMSAGQLQVGASGARVISDSAANMATSFSSNVIVAGNFDAANFDWIFLASGTLTAAAATLTVAIPPPTSNEANNTVLTDMRIMISVPAVLTAAGIWELQFNADTANDYATSISEGLAAVTNNTSKANLALGTASNTDSGYCAVEGSIVPAFAKSFTIRCTRTGGVVTTAPILIVGSGFWSNATATVTSVKLLNSGTGNFPVGTTIRFFGAQ